MSDPFPEPTAPTDSRRELFLRYLDYFRSVLVDKLDGLSDEQLRGSVLPSGWTPIELLKHLSYVERRWLVWGFSGDSIDDPWGDRNTEGRWYVGADESLADLLATYRAQAATSRAVIEGHDLSDIGQPGPRWDGADPASLERILLHLVQEYARHVGHLDIVRELIDGRTGE